MTEELNDAPTAVYEFRDENGDLLYVGITQSLKRRWREHSDDKEWWDEVVEKKVVGWFDTRQRAQTIEQALIQDESPRYNFDFSEVEPMPASPSRLGYVKVDGVEHGKASTYRNHKCRCAPCRKASTIANREARNKKAGRPEDAIRVWVSKVDAELMAHRLKTPDDGSMAFVDRIKVACHQALLEESK